MLNVNTTKIETSVFYSNGYKVRVATRGFVFIGLLTTTFSRVHQIEVYTTESGLEIFQGYAQQDSETFKRLSTPLLNAAKQNRAACH